jgi:dethiobiotin synthetase
MNIKIFITGTDTGIGKTYISTGVLRAFNAKGLTTLGIKPLAAGCKTKNDQLYNDDALALQKASSEKLAYNKINPIALAPPIAPNIAAKQSNYKINMKTMHTKIKDALEHPADICLVEGIGGWNVPINSKETMADFVKKIRLPIILVVGIKLGCLNHALLTYRAIKNDQIPCIGWIANCVEADMSACHENIATLKEWLTIPWLGTVGYQKDPAKILDVDAIIKHVKSLKL